MVDRNGQSGRLRVLLVEDNRDDEFLATWVLKRAGLEQIAVASDGSEALEMLSGEEPVPDLLILDLRLPRIDGREVLRRVRADGRTVNLPVLILTSSEDRGDKEFCQRHGCVEFASKPLTARVIKQVLGLIEK